MEIHIILMDTCLFKSFSFEGMFVYEKKKIRDWISYSWNLIPYLVIHEVEITQYHARGGIGHKVVEKMANVQ